MKIDAGLFGDHADFTDWLDGAYFIVAMHH